MTDRIKGLTIALDRDYRDDDVQAIVDAIMMIKGVQSVKKSIANHEDWINRVQIRTDLQRRLFDALKDDTKS
jgi:hypothetical protein